MDTPKRKRTCLRAGCGRGVRDGCRRCSYLCDTVNSRTEQVERMCCALGPAPLCGDVDLGCCTVRRTHA